MGELEQMIQDPSVTGTGGLRGITPDFRGTYIRNSIEKMYNPNTNNEDGKVSIDMKGHEQDFNKLFSDISAINNDSPFIGDMVSGYGDSTYDKEIQYANDLHDLEDFRSRQQSGALQFINGVGKCAVLTTTTALDSTIGTIWGFVSALGTIGDGQDGTFWEKFYTNDFTKTMDDINKASEKWMPNYRTKEERENKWYQNFGTVNFWADNIIKNAGFTMGTALGTAVTGLVTGGTGVAARLLGGTAKILGASARGVNFAEKTAVSLMSGFNEAKFEALHGYEEYSDRYKLENNVNQLDHQIATLDEKYKEYVNRMKEGEQPKLDEEGRVKVPGIVHTPEEYAELEGEYNRLREELVTKRDEARADYQQRARSAANTLMGLNTAFLTISNSLGTFSGFKGSFTNSLRNADIGWKIAGKYRPTLTRNIKGAGSALVEAHEELHQGFLNNYAGNLYSKKYNEDERGNLINTTSVMLESAKDAFLNTYGNIDTYEEAFAGLMTGITGVPFPHKVKGKDGKEKLQIMQGGIFDLFDKENNQRAKEVADFINNSNEGKKTAELFKSLVRDASITREQLDALMNNDKFEYENQNLNKMVNTILMYKSAGKLNELKSLIGDPDVITDEEFDSYIEASTGQDENGNIVNDFGFIDKDGNLTVTTPEEKAKAKEKILAHRKKTLDTIDKLSKAMDSIDIKTQGKMSDSALETASWMQIAIQDLNDRTSEMSDELSKNEGLRRILDKLSNIEDGGRSKLEELFDKLTGGKMKVGHFISSQIGKLLDNFDQMVESGNGDEKITMAEKFGDYLASEMEKEHISNEDIDKLKNYVKDIMRARYMSNNLKNELNKYLDKPETLENVIRDIDNKVVLSDISKNYNESIAKLDNAQSDEELFMLLSNMVNNKDNSFMNNAVYSRLKKSKFKDKIKGVEKTLSFANVISNMVNDNDSLNESQKGRIRELSNRNLFGKYDFDESDKFLDDAQEALNDNDFDYDDGSRNNIGNFVDDMFKDKSDDLNEFISENRDYLLGHVAMDESNLVVTEDGRLTLNDKGTKEAIDEAKRRMLLNDIALLKNISQKAKDALKEREDWCSDEFSKDDMSKLISELNQIVSENTETEGEDDSNESSGSSTANSQAVSDKAKAEYEKSVNTGRTILKEIADMCELASKAVEDKDFEQSSMPKILEALVILDNTFSIDNIATSKLLNDNSQFKDGRMSKDAFDEIMKYILSEDVKRAMVAKDCNKELTTFVKFVQSMYGKFRAYVEGNNGNATTANVLFNEDGSHSENIASILISNMSEIIREKLKDASSSDIEEGIRLFNLTVIDGLERLANSKKETSRLIKDKAENSQPLDFTSDEKKKAALDINDLINSINKKREEEKAEDAKKAEEEKKREEEEKRKAEMTETINKATFDLDNSYTQDGQQNSAENAINTLEKNNSSAIPTEGGVRVENRATGQVNVLQPRSTELHIGMLIDQNKKMSFANGCDFSNNQMAYNPHEVEDFLVKNGAFEFINNGNLNYIWNNGKYNHQLFVITDEELNGGLRPDAKNGDNIASNDKNYQYIGNKAGMGIGTFYVFKNEKLILDDKGKVVRLEYDKDGSGAPLFERDENGRKVERIRDGIEITVVRNGVETREKMEKYINEFRQKSLYPHLFFAVRLNDGSMQPIGLMPAISSVEGNVESTDMYRNIGFNLQLEINAIFDRLSTKNKGGGQSEIFAYINELPTQLGTSASPIGTGRSLNEYHGGNNVSMRQIFEAEAYKYYTENRKRLEKEGYKFSTSEVDVINQYGSVVKRTNKISVLDKDGRMFEYRQDPSLKGKMVIGNNYYFFGDNKGKHALDEAYSVTGILVNGNKITKEEFSAKRENALNYLSNLLDITFEKNSDRYITTEAKYTKKRDENGTEVTDTINATATRAYRIDGFEIEGIINGFFKTSSREEGIRNIGELDNGSDDISTLIDDGSVSLGIVIEREGNRFIYSKENAIELPKYSDDSKNPFKTGMSVMMVSNADGSMTPIPLITARYSNENTSHLNDEKINSQLNIAATHIQKLQEAKTSEEINDAIFGAFNAINEVVHAPLNDKFIFDGKEVKLHSNMRKTDKRIIIELKGESDGTTVKDGRNQDYRWSIDTAKPVEDIVKSLQNILTELQRPIKISRGDVNDSDSMNELVSRGVLQTNVTSLMPVNGYFQVARSGEKRTSKQKREDAKILKRYSELRKITEQSFTKKSIDNNVFINVAGTEYTLYQDPNKFNVDIVTRDGEILDENTKNALNETLGFTKDGVKTHNWDITKLISVLSEIKRAGVFAGFGKRGVENSDLTNTVFSGAVASNINHNGIFRLNQNKQGETKDYIYYDSVNGNVYFDSFSKYFDDERNINATEVDGLSSEYLKSLNAQNTVASQQVQQQTPQQQPEQQTQPQQPQQQAEQTQPEQVQTQEQAQPEQQEQSNVSDYIANDGNHGYVERIDMEDHGGGVESFDEANSETSISIVVSEETKSNTENEVVEMFRKKTNDYERMNFDTELKMLERMLPWMTLGDRVKLVKHLNNVAKNGVDAWGMFKDNCIYLAENASRGTLYHEAYHAVSMLCLTDKERNELYNELRSDNRFKNLTNKECEEVLAEKFREFVTRRENPDRSLGRKIINWFKELWHKITNFRDNFEIMDSLFDSIYNGSYSKDFSTLKEIYDNSASLKEIGSVSDYMDYINETTKGSKFNGVGYTVKFNNENGESLIIKPSDYSSIKNINSDMFNRFGRKIGFNTSLFINNMAYNRLCSPCIVNTTNNAKNVNRGEFKGIKYTMTESKPIFLGSSDDINGFRNYMKKNVSSKENVWSLSNQDSIYYLESRGLSMEEFSSMPNIVKDKIMECV